MYDVRFREARLMTPRLVPLLALTILMLCQTGARAATGVIESGDTLRVIVLGANDLCGEVTVNPDGAISMPLVGNCKVAGKTTDQVATELAAVLRRYVKEPQVTVGVAQKATWVVVVSGRVKKPGAYQVGSRTSLLELVGLAGGPDENADLASVNLIHLGIKTPETVNLQELIDGKTTTANPTLSIGDIVMVPEKVATLGVVFVLGEVKRIGSCELRRGMRIHEAIGQAGGTTDLADPQAASLKSKDGEPVKFDLTKALAQDTAEDKMLSPGDTIYIQPTSGTFNIYGAVNRPGSYPIRQSIPLTDALAQAGGYTARAKIQNTRILRSSQAKSIPINLASVQKMRADNIAILPGDTIVIPERGDKTSIWQVLSAVGTLGWLVWR